MIEDIKEYDNTEEFLFSRCKVSKSLMESIEIRLKEDKIIKDRGE